MQELIHIRGKLLGVDFGDKRTGLAVSDEGQRMASGICQIQVGGMQKTAEETALGSCGKICPSAGRGFRITGRTAGRAHDHYGGIPLPQRD